MDGKGVDVSKCLNILGLGEGASDDEIKKNYKKLALIYHPDKNTTDPEATRKFQEINEAYNYLTHRGEIDDDETSAPYEEDFDLLNLLRFFAQMNDMWHRPRNNLFFYDDDDYDDDEAIYYHESYDNGPKTNAYSERYKFSCGQTSYENHCRLKNESTGNVGAGMTPEANKTTKGRRKKEKQRQQQERHEQEARQQKGKSEDCGGRPTTSTTPQDSDASRGQHSGQAKKPTKKELLTEQRRREKEMTAIAEELQQHCEVVAERERKRLEKEKEKRSLLTQSLRSDADLEDDLKTPLAEKKAASKQLLGPTKTRRKRQTKQQRRLARMQNKSQSAEMNGRVSSQAYHSNGVMPASTYKVPSDEEWNEECDQYLDSYTRCTSTVDPRRKLTATVSPVYKQPAYTLTETQAQRGYTHCSPPLSHPTATAPSSHVIDSVKHNNQFKSSLLAQHTYNEKFPSGFCAPGPGCHVCDDVINETVARNEFDNMPPGESDDWPADHSTDWPADHSTDWPADHSTDWPADECAKGIPFPVLTNTPDTSRAGHLSTINDFTTINGFGEDSTVNSNMTAHQTGRTPVASSVWSEPVTPTARNVWRERQEFVNEVLPLSVDEEEEMLRVAIEMSMLQMQEDELRREMWEEELELHQLQ